MSLMLTEGVPADVSPGPVTGGEVDSLDEGVGGEELDAGGQPGGGVVADADDEGRRPPCLGERVAQQAQGALSLTQESRDAGSPVGIGPEQIRSVQTLQLRVDRELLAWHAVQREAGGDLCNARRAPRDDRPINDYENDKNDDANDVTSANNEAAECVNDAASRAGPLVAVEEHEACRGDVER